MSADHKDQGNLEVITLSYATRLIFSEMDRRLIIERSLESIADMTQSRNLAMFLLDQNHNTLELAGWLGPHGFSAPQMTMPLEQSPLAQALETKQAALFRLGDREEIPWPHGRPEDGKPQCLCAPMVAADNVVTGFVCLESNRRETGGELLSMPLRILLTVASVALETARLFNESAYDGLTGLFSRRYFDHRLAEEEARVRRYGGMLSLVMADIDFFKKVNDTYGHQQGDQVLVETAGLLQKAVRQELDMACRYGGEEFVVIMPQTGFPGAMVAAERIRTMMEEHAFGGQEEPLRVTLSLGVASMTQATLVSGAELLSRSDQALYRAKEQGRNQVCAWEE